jgi:hypothetical protein
MMRPKKVEHFLPPLNSIASDFVGLVKQRRDKNNEVPNFATELGMWSLESKGNSDDLQNQFVFW